VISVVCILLIAAICVRTQSGAGSDDGNGNDGNGNDGNGNDGNGNDGNGNDGNGHGDDDDSNGDGVGDGGYSTRSTEIGRLATSSHQQQP
jgi:hypothetical protein